MRICSLLPSATETLFALGLGGQIVGVTHECDFPREAREKRVVLRSNLPHAAGSAEINRNVSQAARQGTSLYVVDDTALRELAPDLIITQDLCHLCAASPGDLAAALATLPRAPLVLSLTPHTLADVWRDIRSIGEAAGAAPQGDRLARQLGSRVAQVEEITAALPERPRVVCLEWLDPPFIAGHWLPEMLRIAGGRDVLGRPGEKSPRITWEQAVAAQPEVILVAPCGFDLPGAVAEFRKLTPPPGWSDLPAVRQRHVFALDANSYASRPGPRLANAVWILASLLHPARFTLSFPPNTVQQL